jgi:hypothetical protein
VEGLAGNTAAVTGSARGIYRAVTVGVSPADSASKGGACGVEEGMRQARRNDLNRGKQ